MREVQGTGEGFEVRVAGNETEAPTVEGVAGGKWEATFKCD